MSDIQTLLGPPAGRRKAPSGQVEKIYSRRQVEQAFLQVFEMIGGVPRLARWAHEEANYETFLKLLPAILPKSVLEQAGAGELIYMSNVPASPLNREPPGVTQGELVENENAP